MNSKFSVAGQTDVGLVRTGNEDNFIIVEDEALFVVCDGMGGHLAGEVASKEGCDIMSACFKNLADDLAASELLKLPAVFPKRGDLLVKAARLANRAIFLKAGMRQEQAGMGTTLASVALEDDLIHVAHVGDSRVYRLTDENLVRLTTDHSWVSELQQTGALSEKEAANFTNKNIITRALGVKETVEVDYRCDKVTPGEVYIICSDGLCGYAEDDEIYAVVRECNRDVKQIVGSLVQMANDHGGLDNVTIIAIRIEPSKSEIVEPVTIGVEDSDTLIEQDRMIKRLHDLSSFPGVNNVNHNSKTKENHLPLILIFVAFIVIVAIIYFMMVK